MLNPKHLTPSLLFNDELRISCRRLPPFAHFPILKGKKREAGFSGKALLSADPYHPRAYVPLGNQPGPHPEWSKDADPGSRQALPGYPVASSLSMKIIVTGPYQKNQKAQSFQMVRNLWEGQAPLQTRSL